ncbi:hypothetical protein V8B97DRAFT_2024528 [Scleroderma yunnanense]
MTSPQSIYAKLLTRVEPERYPQYRETGLRIGDVGVVTAHGSFDVFFNICLPEDHPLHATYGVPEGFKQIQLADHDMESIQPGDHRGRVIATQSISQKKMTVGMAAEIPGLAARQGDIGIEFSSSSNEGALLVLPEEALRSGKSWYEFAVTKLGRTRISADSLYLITGCHKTSSWSLAAFHQSSGGCNFNAQFTAGKIVNGNISAAYSWQMSSAIPCRIGPEPYNEVKNQTVFIRGFKIAIRESTFFALLRGTVTVSYGSPNAASRKAHSSQRAKGWLGSKSENQSTEGAMKVFGTSSLDFGSPHEVGLSATAAIEGKCHEHASSSTSDISLYQIPPTRKIYHPSDSLIKCIMQSDINTLHYSPPVKYWSFMIVFGVT